MPSANGRSLAESSPDMAGVGGRREYGMMRLIDEGMDEGMDGNEDEDRCLGSLGQFAVVGQRRTDGGRGVQGGDRKSVV